MKKVVFVCLLTISVCLSQPAKESGPDNKTNTDAAASTITTTVAPPKDAANKTTDLPKPDDKATNGTHNGTVPPATNDTSLKPNNETIPKNDTNGKNDTSTPKPTEAPTPSTQSTPTVAPTKPTPSAPSTPKAPAVPTTANPNVSTAATPTLQARGFDGASFVGGIILTLGLLAVGFMGFRYYKTQTERNYHTL